MAAVNKLPICSDDVDRSGRRSVAQIKHHERKLCSNYYSPVEHNLGFLFYFMPGEPHHQIFSALSFTNVEKLN